jgi:hypothetical protein
VRRGGDMGVVGDESGMADFVGVMDYALENRKTGTIVQILESTNDFIKPHQQLSIVDFCKRDIWAEPLALLLKSGKGRKEIREAARTAVEEIKMARGISSVQLSLPGEFGTYIEFRNPRVMAIINMFTIKGLSEVVEGLESKEKKLGDQLAFVKALSGSKEDSKNAIIIFETVRARGKAHKSVLEAVTNGLGKIVSANPMESEMRQRKKETVTPSGQKVNTRPGRLKI